VRNFGPIAAVAGLVLAAGLSSSAQAILMLSAAVDGTTVLQCSDNQGPTSLCPGGDQSLLIGTLQLQNGTFSGVELRGSISTSLGTPGNPSSLDILNTSSLNIINHNATTSKIEAAVGDTSFKGPITSFSTSTSGTFQTAINSTIAIDFWNDPANAQGATSPTSHPGMMIDSFSKSVLLITDSYSHNNTGPVTDPALFSMTEHVVLDLVPNGQLVNRGSTEIKSVPAPLIGHGLFLLLAVGGVLFGGKLLESRKKHPGTATPHEV